MASVFHRYVQQFVLWCVAASCAVNLAAVQFPLAWNWSNPLPHGGNIIDIATTNGLGVQVAERGQMFTSSDMQVWAPADTHTTAALRAVTFFKGSIVAVGESGTVVTGSSGTNLTLLNLQTTDWLEGVAASADLLVAAGDNGSIYTSPDASHWQRQTTPFNNWLRSAAYGTPSGLGTFVVVGEAGFVATSRDGVTWKTQKAQTSEDLNRVAWFSGEFWALGDSGVAFSSTSGTQWSPANSGATNILNAFAATSSSRLLAGESEVRLRNGKTSWSDELDLSKPYPPPDWTYLSATTVSNNWLLCGRTGMMVEGIPTTTNNTTVWFPLSDSLWNWLWDVKRFPNIYLAVGDRATILSSLDGFSWDTEVPPPNTTNSVFLGIGGTTNQAVVVGSVGSIISSLDGVQSVVTTNSDGTLSTNQVNTLGLYWRTAQVVPTSEDLQGITDFNGQFVATGGAGTILTSPDAVAWTKQNAPTSQFLSSVVSFPGGLVAVGKGGTILTSPDAVTWSSRSLPTTNWIYRVRYLGNKLIALGENGTLLTSSDGQLWTPQNSGTTAWLNDAQWIDGTYFVVGDQGTVLTSPDSLQWTDRGTITGKSLFAAATADGLLVVTGVEGVILRSQVSPFDATIHFLQFPVRPDDKSFLFSGHPGQQFTLDRSSNVFSWSVGPLLQINANGTLPFTDTSSNSNLRQFFRATPK